jgi:hypothetical protein
MTGTLRADPEGLIAVAGALEALADQLGGLVDERAARLTPPAAGGDEVSRAVVASIGAATHEVMADVESGARRAGEFAAALRAQAQAIVAADTAPNQVG